MELPFMEVNMKETKEEYKDIIAFLYDNRELLPPGLRKIVEDEMADIFIDDLINRLADVIFKKQQNGRPVENEMEI